MLHNKIRTVYLRDMNLRLFDSPCRSGIYFPRKMNVEADLSLVREEC